MRRHLAQHAVAGGMAEALVDDLEPIDVEEDHGDLLRLGAVIVGPAGERLDDPLDEHLAGGQPRHRVAPSAGLLLQPRVLEGDRRQLGEPVQRVDLGLVPRALHRARRQAEHPDDPPADVSGTPTPAPTMPVKAGEWPSYVS